MDVVCWYHHRRHEVKKDHISYRDILEAPLEGVL